MVSGDHITQEGQYFGPFNVGDHARFLRHALKVRRVLDVGGRCRPIVGLAVGRLHALPFVVAFEDVGIFGLERFTGDRLFHQLCNFLRRGPNVFEVDVIAVFVLTNHVGRQIDVQCASQCIGYNKRWRCEVVGAYIRADTPFKVPVAGKNRSGDQITICDGFAKFWLDGT